MSSYLLRDINKKEPASIEHYIEHGGYGAIKKALSMNPAEILKEIRLSKLKGRSGSGIPLSVKWNVVLNKRRFPKYLICNANEGEPGSFKDKFIIQY
ncbi:MAG: hypothetical protein D6828_01160, partial [Nitrospirae bacterium]